MKKVRRKDMSPFRKKQYSQPRLGNRRPSSPTLNIALETLNQIICSEHLDFTLILLLGYQKNNTHLIYPIFESLDNKGKIEIARIKRKYVCNELFSELQR